MKRTLEWIMALLFSGVLLCAMLVTIVKPKPIYSYFENRNLSTFPEINCETVIGGKVFSDLETYFCDYAAGRTTALKAVTWSDLNIFRRPLVNDVVVTEHALLARLSTNPDTEEEIRQKADTVAKQNADLQAQIEAYGGKYCYLAVPCQYAFYEDEYPFYMENYANYTDIEIPALTNAMEKYGVSFVDIGKVFDAEGHLPEFSSLADNHYGLRGAYVTYRAAAEKLAEEGITLNFPEEGKDITFSELPNPYMGSRTRELLGMRGNNEHLLTAAFTEDIPFRRFDEGNESPSAVYFIPSGESAQVTYGLYMGQDHAETVIQTDRPELPSCLIYGDSFTNAVECLAYYSFDEMRSIDLRHYTEHTLSEYIELYKPDVVICIRDYQALLLQEGNGVLS